MESVDIVKSVMSELSGNVPSSKGMGVSEWWGSYEGLVRTIELQIEECEDRDRLGWVRLKKDVLELGARVSGILKQSDVPVTIEKMLVVVEDKAMRLLERS